MKSNSFIVCILLLGAVECFSQGFINLNFENAVIKTNGAPQGAIIASNAIPGWTAYNNGVSQTYIAYNDVSLGAAGISLHGTNSFFPSIQGNYFIYLQGSSAGQQSSAAIGQTGQIPLSALSLLFWGDVFQVQLSFNSQTLPFSLSSVTANYNIYQADISPYSGQTGMLLFLAAQGAGGFIDNIQFSATAVPEPNQFALAALGTLLLGFRRWKNYMR